MKKRRLLSIVLSLCMVLALMPQMVFAETTADGNFEYSVSGNEVKITKYTGSTTEVTIPDTINDNPVTAIGGSAFYAKSNIKSVKIPGSVTSIGRYAFYMCSELSSVTFGKDSQLTSIGNYAFNNCTKLNSIILPDSVTSIGEEAFNHCKSLASIDIPDGVTTIGDSAFGGCSSLANVTFGDNSKLASIGVQAFVGCASLKSIEIPDSITSIGYGAFNECTSLESIEIPGSITSIEQATFHKCRSLKNVTFGKDSQLTSIGDHAFWECTSLESIEIPSSVTSIGGGAFDSCTNLKSIEIPSSVTSIGNYAFDGCTTLESIFLPKDLDVTNAEIPDATSQVRYSLDTERGEVTITGITLGTSKTGVAIPETICGYPVVAVTASEQYKVGAHTCKGGTATCTDKALCSICGKEYGEIKPDNHSGKLAWGTTETQHKQYWNCCNAVVVDYENHTWNSGVCSVCDYVCNHTGGEATCISKAVCDTCGEEYGELNSSNHDLVNTPAKDATVTETGNKEYWQCTDCDKYFADENGTEEITLDKTVISKLKPEIIEGTGQSITAGEKKALTFRSNASFDDFKRVELDGKTLDGDNYTVKEGSIIVTLDADYVATLPAGEHTIGIISESGTAETTFTVEEKAASGTSDDSDKDSKSDDEDSAKTGDDTNLALWLALMLLSGAGITGVTAYTRRKRTNE